MKKIIYLLTLIPFLALGQSPDQNWVKTITYKQPTATPIANPDVSVANVQVSYFDGLGRPIQQVAPQLVRASLNNRHRYRELLACGHKEYKKTEQLLRELILLF